MKNVIVTLTVAVVAVAAYGVGRMQGETVVHTPPASWAGESDAAQAWRELAMSLEAAGARVFEAAGPPGERLEGLAYLAQLLSASLEMKLAKGRPDEPRFTNWMEDYRKLLGDSPDAVYHSAEVSSALRYEITGNVGDADYLGFVLYGRGLNGWNREAAGLSHEDLSIDADGDFRIRLGGERPDQASTNWLALDSDIHMIMVRQYFHDRLNSREATLSIRAITDDAAVTADEPALASGLRKATAFFNSTLAGTVALAEMLSDRPNHPEPPKAYNADFAGIFYPTSDNRYLGTWFRVAEDEALVIEGDVPDAPYWSVSLQNRWLQSLDYRNFQVSLNDRQIETRDGRYRIVLSHRRPPTGNWLDAAGHVEGILAIRYQQPRSETPAPALSLVKFDAL